MKIHIEPMIKQQPGYSRRLWLTVAIILGLAFAASVGVSVWRIAEYSKQAEMARRV